jgi:ubiquinone/menaquinone biosynthesis C-methylase UbiE
MCLRTFVPTAWITNFYLREVFMSSTIDLTALKQRMRDTWMAGDFGVIASYNVKLGEQFVSRINIQPAMKVLDVACGTGNVTLPAARAGATVTGVDIAPNLLEQARGRARKEGLSIQFDEGDAESLPYPDALFDIVLSMFGAMFAPRPEVVAAELLRVCRPGGLIAMGNWTPTGFTGKMFKTTARHVPPPLGVPPPVLWGDEATVRQRFGGGVSHLTCTPQNAEFRYNASPAAVVQLFRQYFGPTQMAFARLDAAGQAALEADLVGMWAGANGAKDGTTLVQNEFLEVHAVRA